jgi:GcrA cell cycle regulator
MTQLSQTTSPHSGAETAAPSRIENTRTDTGWTQERVEMLRTLWAEGLSAARIAIRLGDVSRCAVLGKVYRLKLPSRATRVQFKPGVRRQPLCLPLAPSPRHRRPSLKRRPFLRLIVNPAPPLPELPPPAKLLPLLALGADQCRWPYGEPKTPGFGFCGRECVPGFAYCPGHVRQAYQPAKPRKRP